MTDPNPSIDHDRLFKELLSTFFLEFLELFLPELRATIDPNSIQFLPQEYFADLTAGEEKIIDLYQINKCLQQMPDDQGCGYKNEARLRGLEETSPTACGGRLCSCSRAFRRRGSRSVAIIN
jgi:hypothetical protein